MPIMYEAVYKAPHIHDCIYCSEPHGDVGILVDEKTEQ